METISSSNNYHSQKGRRKMAPRRLLKKSTNITVLFIFITINFYYFIDHMAFCTPISSIYLINDPETSSFTLSSSSSSSSSSASSIPSSSSSSNTKIDSSIENLSTNSSTAKTTTTTTTTAIPDSPFLRITDDSSDVNNDKWRHVLKTMTENNPCGSYENYTMCAQCGHWTGNDEAFYMCCLNIDGVREYCQSFLNYDLDHQQKQKISKIDIH